MPSIELHAALKRHLDFISRSCQSFDAGFHDEALRVALSIRVLVQDTKQQESLLTQLNAKTTTLTSTCCDIASELRDPNSFLTFGSRRLSRRLQMFNGMGSFRIDSAGIHYSPKLEKGMFRYGLPVPQWWAQTVFILDPEAWVTRQDVVLNAADKEIFHVDAKLTPMYLCLVESSALGDFVRGATMKAARNREASSLSIRWSSGTQKSPISGHHYVALRQMGYELLNSPALLALSR